MIFGGRRKLHVGSGIQAGLHGILDDADDEADTHHLHGDVIADAEQRAGHWNKQQRATGHTGSAACAERRHHNEI